jgi:hypothetical protein
MKLFSFSVIERYLGVFTSEVLIGYPFIGDAIGQKKDWKFILLNADP